MKTLAFAIFLSVILVHCTSRSTTGTVFSKDSLINVVKILSADSLGGRKPFSRYEALTVDYIQRKFASMGLEPGNGGGWFQEVPMVSINAIAEPAMQVQAPRGNFALKAPQEYIVWTDRTEPSQTLRSTDVVFAGYGVVAPEYGWNDYAGLDVRGKLVMALVNDPGFNAGDTSLFKGNTMTYYGRWTYKFEEAARQGASGCLIVHTTKAAGYPFAVQQASFNTARLQLDSRGKEQQLCNVIGWITDTAANKLFAAAGMDGASLMASADKKGFKAVALPLRLSTSLTVQTQSSTSKNVIGKITGSKYPNETIIYTAHWDHLGIGKPDAKGDSIYNGAYDNATGIAGLFELARAFKTSGNAPERTIVFLAVTAEEQGLLGSAWYSSHPVFPIATTVANINMDGLNNLGRTKDVILVGKGQSELEDLIAEEAKKQGRYIGEEDHPEAGYYYRSDHFNFAKAGVPSLHFDDGVDMPSMDRKQVDAAKEEYRLQHYHKPSDEYNNTWNLDGALDDLQLYYMLGMRLANGRVWPQWKPGSEFRAVRDQTATSRT